MLNLILSTASFRREEYFTYSSRRLWFFVPKKQHMVNNAHLLWLEFVFFSKFKIIVHVFVGSFHLCARFDALCDSAFNSFKTVSYTEDDYKRRNHSLRYQIRWVKPTSKQFLSNFVNFQGLQLSNFWSMLRQLVGNIMDPRTDADFESWECSKRF